LKGDKFLEIFGTHNDPVTKIKPSKVYAVKAPTAHPIYENFRVQVLSLMLISWLMLYFFPSDVDVVL
jgi:L-arabinokinase